MLSRGGCPDAVVRGNDRLERDIAHMGQAAAIPKAASDMFIPGEPLLVESSNLFVPGDGLRCGTSLRILGIADGVAVPVSEAEGRNA